MKKILLVIFVLILTGCAKTSFYADKELKTETGIPIYGAKAFILVKEVQINQDGKTQPKIEVSVEYITDYSHPLYYIKSSPGIGSNDLQLTLEHGQLVTIGNKTDSKIPEMLTSTAGLITESAKILQNGVTQDNRFSLYEIVFTPSEDGTKSHVSLKKLEIKNSTSLPKI